MKKFKEIRSSKVTSGVLIGLNILLLMLVVNFYLWGVGITKFGMSINFIAASIITVVVLNFVFFNPKCIARTVVTMPITGLVLTLTALFLFIGFAMV